MANFINTKIPMEIEAELKSKLEQLYNRVESLKEQIRGSYQKCLYHAFLANTRL